MTIKEKPPWLEGIEGEALIPLITSDARVIRVVAGPGSGKTTGLKRRVMRLIEGDSVQPENIFVGTFTRAIANELSQEIGISATSDELGEGRVDIEVLTLHALALKLIRDYPAARPGRTLRFLLGFEKDAMLYDIGEVIDRLPNQRDRNKELKRVCAAWAEGTKLGIAEFVGEMDRWLRRHGGMLIDEVVQFARIGLESGDIPAGNFDHVIIDEYQDLTAAEQQLVEKIWSGTGALVVLGDDDQSIYSFRYNHPRGIMEFADRLREEPLEDLGLPDNRRSGRVIVTLANSMMALAGSKKAPMISKRIEAGDLSLVYWPTVEAEVIGLAKYVKAKKDTDFLILVPRRFIGYRLKEAIGADAQTSFHEEVLEEQVVQERLAMISLFANPEDRVALRAVLSFHSNGIEYGPKRNAEAYRSIHAGSLGTSDILKGIVEGKIEIGGRGSRHLRVRASRALDFFERFSNNPNLEIVIRTVFNPELAAEILDIEDREKAKQNLEQLLDATLTLLGKSKDPNLNKILDNLRYRIAMRIPLGEVSKKRVRIMTLHGAKGLEAEKVIVAGVADQIIPGIGRDNPEETERAREEQRRLLYVSVTRAKGELLISWPQAIKFKDATKNNVRIDRGSVLMFRGGEDKVVRLGRTTLLPDLPGFTRSGRIWLREKIGN